MSNTITKEKVNFSMIPNDLLADQNLSLTAKGLYAFMHSKPDGWNFTIRSMSKQLKEGVTAISNALNELKESGWVTYTKHTDGTGSYHLAWNNPNPENPDQGFTNLGKPVRISNTDYLTRKINTTPIAPKGDDDDVSYQKIVDTYHECLDSLPTVRMLTSARRKALRSRIREDAKRKDLDWWRGYFEYAASIPFLAGKGESDWKPNFDWLINETNMVKVIEGKYQND